MRLIKKDEIAKFDKTTQMEVILSFFFSNKEKEIKHPEIVDWATQKWKEMTGKVFRDPDRAIRTLYTKGFLIKISKGVYKFNDNFKNENDKTIFTFSEKQKKIILKKGDYKCSICGEGNKSKEMHVDHIKAMSDGGTNDASNGQILCSKHNFLKKNYSQTETGKRMFFNLRNLALKDGDQDLINFIDDILMVYEKHNINGHIKWKKDKK